MFVETIKSPLKEGKVLVDPQRFLDMPDPYTRPFRSHTPTSVELYLTRRCNLNCIYCYADAAHERFSKNKNEEMDTDMIINLIDQMADMQVESVTLAGGEITLRPDLVDIIRYLIDYDISIHFPSNACLINDNLAQALVDVGLTKVQAKLDAGDPKIQDKISRVKGSFDQLIGGIKTLKDHSFEVAVVMVVTALNVKELPSVAEICADLNVLNFTLFL